MGMSLTAEDKQWILEQVQRQEERFSEKLEGMETRLLTAFHHWASPAEARLRAHTATITALDVEMLDVKERLDRLEGKKPS